MDGDNVIRSGRRSSVLNSVRSDGGIRSHTIPDVQSAALRVLWHRRSVSMDPIFLDFCNSQLCADFFDAFIHYMRDLVRREQLRILLLRLFRSGGGQDDVLEKDAATFRAASENVEEYFKALAAKYALIISRFATVGPASYERRFFENFFDLCSHACHKAFDPRLYNMVDYELNRLLRTDIFNVKVHSNIRKTTSAFIPSRLIYKVTVEKKKQLPTRQRRRMDRVPLHAAANKNSPMISALISPSEVSVEEEEPDLSDVAAWMAILQKNDTYMSFLSLGEKKREETETITF